MKHRITGQRAAHSKLGSSMTARSTHRKGFWGQTALGALFAAALAGLAPSALAQTGEAPAPAAAAEPQPQPQPDMAGALPEGPTSNAMVNLIRLLVQQGTITEENGRALVAQAQTEAQMASATPAPPAAGAVRVPYVPQIVRDQIRDEVKADIARTAETSGWIAPARLPAWAERLTISGDIRFRSQSELYSASNVIGLIDFGEFNRSGPVDINPVIAGSSIPFINTRNDQWNRLSVRARLAVDAKLTNGVSGGIRLATGSNDSPIATTQLLGGGFGKKDIWLDRAYIHVQPIEYAGLTVGRFANPFLSTDILYDADLNFDGIAARIGGRGLIGENIGVRLTGGAFPLEYGADDFPTIGVVKDQVDTKWLFAGQLDVDVTFAGDNQAKLWAGYHSFKNVQGNLSAACDTYLGDFIQCSTDNDRPLFLSRGNTLFTLRNISPDPTSPGNFSQPQFVGLVMDYDVLDIGATVDVGVNDTMHVVVSGNYLRNLSYEGNPCRFGELSPVTNIGAEGDVSVCGTAATGQTKDEFLSGGTAWRAAVSFGSKDLTKRGAWNVMAAYKRIEPDAVLDGYLDSEFHLGGTNAKGYQIEGSYSPFDRLTFTARWLSANEVFGPPLAIDVLQFDLVYGF